MNKFFTLLIFTLCFFVSNAKTQIVEDKVNASSVIVSSDERIDILLNKKIYIGSDDSEEWQKKKKKTTVAKTKVLPSVNKEVKVDVYGRANIYGYKIQVLNSTDRALVYQTKSRLYQMYPSQKLTVVAQAPFYKLRFGNFVSKAEAEKYKKALTPMFPQGVFIVSDIIEGRVRQDKKAPVTEKVPVK